MKFETAIGTENAFKVIKDLSKKQLIKLNDAAIVTWPMGKKKPKTKHLADLTGAGALSGAFWGMLVGRIFLFLYLAWSLKLQ